MKGFPNETSPLLSEICEEESITFPVIPKFWNNLKNPPNKLKMKFPVIDILSEDSVEEVSEGVDSADGDSGVVGVISVEDSVDDDSASEIISVSSIGAVVSVEETSEDS